MFKVIILSLCFISYCKCAFFDLTDVDDPLSLLWNNRPAFVRPRNSECKTNTPVGPKHGVCQNPSICMMSGGRPNGICGVFATCCTYESSCGKTTNQKVSYFQKSNMENANECKYEVYLLNSNICQIRLDFETFHVAPASVRNNISRCELDRFKIFPNTYNIPELCGNNNNQHVYIHVNQSTGTKKVVLDMITNSNVSPTWKIKVTQLECPGHVNTDDVSTDFAMLAPLGAIQYHTESRGEIRSFGYDHFRNLNSYTSNEKYAIAFMRGGNVCGIKFQVNYLNIPSEESDGIDDKMCSSDYLYVPYLQFEDPSYESIAKICSNHFEKNSRFESVSPGPIMVSFKSGSHFRPGEGEGPNAFYLNYEMMTICN